jgi:ankyrin repeat protein
MIAASNGDIDTCRFLLECGADVNAFDNFKWTPLHHACNSGHLDSKQNYIIVLILLNNNNNNQKKIVVKLLVEKGSNINALSITQATPLMRAVESSSFLVVEYLIEKGAKVIQENINGIVYIFYTNK